MECFPVLLSCGVSAAESFRVSFTAFYVSSSFYYVAILLQYVATVACNLYTSLSIESAFTNPCWVSPHQITGQFPSSSLSILNELVPRKGGVSVASVDELTNCTAKQRNLVMWWQLQNPLCFFLVWEIKRNTFCDQSAKFCKAVLPKASCILYHHILKINVFLSWCWTRPPLPVPHPTCLLGEGLCQIRIKHPCDC